MIDAHRGAFEYDWRTRFHQPLAAIGDSMTWGEAWRLLQQLVLDSTSHVAAAISGWTQPASQEALVAMDLFDFHARCRYVDGGAKGAPPKPYQRPWPTRKKRAKPDASLTQAEIVAALRAAGHTAPIPLQAEVISDG